jgi:hypothetical protein
MKTHQNPLRLLTLSIGLAGMLMANAAPVSTSFTFQGLLKDNNGVPVNGSYDVRVTIAPSSASNDPGFGYSDYLCQPVNNGLVNLQVNFGGLNASIFYNCEARWLEFGVRPCGSTSAYQVLTPRVELLPAPYSLESLKACAVESNGVTTVSIQDGSVTASKIGPGQVVKSLNGLRDTVNLIAGSNVTITPNGNNLQISSTGAGGSGIWNVNGSSTYYNNGNVGIGTANPSRRLEAQGPGDVEIGFRSTDIGGRLWTIQSSQVPSVFFPNIAPVWSGCFQIIDRTAGASRLSILNNGRVGLGTIEPSRNLEVQGPGDVEIGLTSTDAGGRIWTLQSSGNVSGNLGTFQIVDRTASASRMSIRQNGYVGIGTASPFANLELNVPGSTDPINAMFLEVQSFSTPQNAAASYFLRCRDVGAGRSQFVIRGDGNVGIGTDTPQAPLDVAGMTRTCTLQITGGCDLAEPFQISGNAIPKGSLVIIDEEHEGKLKLAAQEYDTRVAGIISGANGVNPGISLHQEGVMEGGENVALSGRVYALADASNGAIKPGDLLTSSSTSGHVMKVTDHTKAQGAIVGKAMSALKQGKGMVLVLVALQ